jgi:hypothetical protein
MYCAVCIVIYHYSEQEIQGDLALCHRDMAVEQSALRKTQQRIKDIIEVMFPIDA